MPDVIDELLSRGNVRTFGSSSPLDLTAAGRHFDAELPRSLVKLWRASEGVALDALDAHIPGPTEVLRLVGNEPWEQLSVERGWLPVLDDHQSNYLAVCVRAPLAYRVLHLPHDDGPRVLYRSFDSCARALVEAGDAGQQAEAFLSETDGDYPPDEPRPVEDQEAAKVLLAAPNDHDEWNQAVRLLDATNLDEWARLLETDHFVRRDVLGRMRKMSSRAIGELLRDDEQAFEAFVTAFIDAVRAAGLRVGDRSGSGVQVGGTWYELDAFFHRRNVRDAMPRMLAWVTDQLAGRNPYDRPGHVMTD